MLAHGAFLRLQAGGVLTPSLSELSPLSGREGWLSMAGGGLKSVGRWRRGGGGGG
jgi:hypothetical protein